MAIHAVISGTTTTILIVEERITLLITSSGPIIGIRIQSGREELVLRDMTWPARVIGSYAFFDNEHNTCPYGLFEG